MTEYLASLQRLQFILNEPCLFKHFPFTGADGILVIIIDFHEGVLLNGSFSDQVECQWRLSHLVDNVTFYVLNLVAHYIHLI